MTILYEILSSTDLSHLTYEEKKEFVSEIITLGRNDYYEKFISLLDKPINDIFTSNEILALIPLDIDVCLFQMILKNFVFVHSQNFFFNYANNSENKQIKELVYDYFVENHSDLLVDNIDMYESLLENTVI